MSHTRRLLGLALALSLVLGPAGCVIGSPVAAFSGEPWGMTRDDWSAIGGRKRGPIWGGAPVFAAVDLPFAFVLDTGLLPISGLIWLIRLAAGGGDDDGHGHSHGDGDHSHSHDDGDHDHDHDGDGEADHTHVDDEDFVDPTAAPVDDEPDTRREDLTDPPRTPKRGHHHGDFLYRHHHGDGDFEHTHPGSHHHGDGNLTHDHGNGDTEHLHLSDHHHGDHDLDHHHGDGDFEHTHPPATPKVYPAGGN